MSYILITPVRNEEAYIEETLKSVASQAVPPSEWVIVSDGSTDRTDEIIAAHAEKHPFIHSVGNVERGAHSFASKVFAIETGLANLTNKDYAFIGILDGDIRLDSTYYQSILDRFHEDKTLGLAGGALLQKIGNRFVDQKINADSVAGGAQVFRRECYEQIGGFIPMPKGGIDSVAEVMARMHGWKTRTLTNIPFYHLKPMNSATGSLFYAKWQIGERDYLIGNHPLFELIRCVYRALERPYIISSIIRLAAYVTLWVRKPESPVPIDVIKYKRREQLKRLGALFGRRRGA